jgi:hypothetical protein
MPEFAPGFPNNTLPKNTTPLTERAVFNEVADKVIGAAAGATATVTRAQVPHDVNNAGRRTAVTSTRINRATTSADISAVKSKVIRKRSSLAFPRDRSGNGGPAFTRA